ncbi:MAG TPA: 3-dehydroquinate synthase, partial [Vineibacter sp.]|nr:3-dehydroquinate synthase [Vineibacter sp.]
MAAASRQVPVELGERRYVIEIGAGLLDRAGALCAPLVASKRAIVVTDSLVAPLHLERVMASLAAAGLRADSVIVPAGESSKEFGAFGRLMEALLDRRPDRGTVLVALGGGVIGDLTGFAA